MERWEQYCGRFLRYGITEVGEIDTEKSHLLVVDYGNLYVASVTDVHSAIYGCWDEGWKILQNNVK